MSYVALYRKFRPQTFDEIKGQDHVVRALKYQLKNHRIGHAYLFTGTRGTGKTSAAKIFAKAVNCLHPVDGEPCNECENCKAVNAGNFVDVVEVDAASNNGVDDIRRIIEEVRYTPVRGEYKVFIIDEAHMITGAAFNAFLKTLEEPPAYAVFILATTEPHKLPITILSRCQRYDFRRISNEDITGNLKEIVTHEEVEAEEKALHYIARAGDGSMRDAVSLLDKCIAFSLGDKLTYEGVLDTLGAVDTEVFSRLFREVSNGDAGAALEIIDDAAAKGRDLTQFTTDFIWYIRNILMISAAGLKDRDVLGISAENMELLRSDAQSVQEDVLMRYIRVLSELLNQIRFSTNKQVLLEVSVIKLAKPQMENDLSSLTDRVRMLETELEAIRAQEISLEHAEKHNIPRMSNPDALAGLLDDEPAYEEQSIAPQPALMTGTAQTKVEINENNSELSPDPEIEKFYATESRNFSSDSEMKETDSSEKDESVATEKEENLTGIWPQIVASCNDARIRMALNKCSVRQIDAKTLRILAPGEFQIKQLKEEKVLEMLKDLASKVAKREINIQVLLASDETKYEPAAKAIDAAAVKDLDAIFPEKLLKNINFNIGTEEY